MCIWQISMGLQGNMKIFWVSPARFAKWLLCKKLLARLNRPCCFVAAGNAIPYLQVVNVEVLRPYGLTYFAFMAEVSNFSALLFLKRIHQMTACNIFAHNLGQIWLSRKKWRLEPQLEKDRCRSTSAKPADKRSPQQRTSQVHRKGNRTVPNLLPELKKRMTLYHVSSIVCTYMGTYIYVPPLMHRNTNSLRRWHVVATCHPTLFQS